VSQRKLRAVFMRGGTSKGLIFRQEDLPPSRDDWGPIFTAAMGSPDPNGRQLDGMGGGVSSVSKVCVVGPATHPDADVDFTFVQVLVTEDVADYGSNCGNMSSAIGPFAIEEGLISGPRNGEAIVRIHNTNTGKIVVSRFVMENGEAAVDGDLVLDGVAGSGAPIRLDFTEPGGSRTGHILPTDNTVDQLELGEFGSIEASLIDVALPVVVVRATDLGLTGFELPADLDAQPAILTKLEAIRRAASVRMGLTADLGAAAALGSVPKVGFVAPSGGYRALSGRAVAAEEMDLAVRMVSMGQPHRATPLTGALCLAAACRIEGTIPNAMTRRGDGALRLGHPSGVVHVDAAVSDSDGQPHVAHATVYRTARRLFEGNVLYRG